MKERYIEFDIARGVAVILMILQHFFYILFSNFISNYYLKYFIFSLGTVLVAPVFLFLMGANIANSRNFEPYKIFIRGLKLILLGYCLSALRFFLPIILCQYLGINLDLEHIIYGLKPIEYLLEVDILQVAGLSLLVIAFLKWKKVKYDYYLILAFFVILISPLLDQITFSTASLTYLFDPLLGRAPYVLFPFFPWFFYSLVGVYFGNLLLKVKDKKYFYKNIFVKLLPLIILGIFFSAMSNDFSPASFYHHNFGASLLFISLVIYWLAFIYLNYQNLSIKIIRPLVFLSKNVTVIYIIQWLIIAWTAILINISY